MPDPETTEPEPASTETTEATPTREHVKTERTTEYSPEDDPEGDDADEDPVEGAPEDPRGAL